MIWKAPMTSDSIVAPSRASRLPRGASRALGATGLAATVGAALVLALRYAPHAADAFVARKHLNQALTDVAYWTSSDPLSGFVTYGLSLAIVFAVVAVYALLDWLASRWLAARIALPCVALLGFVYEYRHQNRRIPARSSSGRSRSSRSFWRGIVAVVARAWPRRRRAGRPRS